MAVNGSEGHRAGPVQVLQDLLDDVRVFDGGDDPHWSTALLTLFYFNGKHTLEPLCPPHRVDLRFRTFLFFYWFLRNDILTQFAIGGELTVC